MTEDEKLAAAVFATRKAFSKALEDAIAAGLSVDIDGYRDAEAPAVKVSRFTRFSDDTE